MSEHDTCQICGLEVEDCQCHWNCECGRELSPADVSDGVVSCERCQRTDRTVDWIEDTETECRQLAERAGWQMELASCASESRSRYYELSRGDKTLLLRISDHGSAYCNEDISLAMEQGGDDHTMEDLEEQLAAM